MVLDLLTLRGRHGTYGTGLALVARSVPTCPSGRRGFLRGRRGTWRHSSSFHVTSVVLGDIHLRFTWQAWHFDILTHNLHTHNLLAGTQLTHAQLAHIQLTHAGVALGDMDLHFAWQAWHLWHWAGSGGALGSHVPEWSPRLFAWQAWRLETWHLRHFTWQAWHLVTSTFVSCGRRGTRLTHFAWQAWHVWHWASSGGALGSHVPEWSPRLFAWQAWHLETFIFVSRGRRGTW